MISIQIVLVNIVTKFLFFLIWKNDITWTAQDKLLIKYYLIIEIHSTQW